MEVMAQSGVDAGDIAAIGITNQRETTILWDKETGRPVYNAIVWQCRRTADICGRAQGRQGLEEYIRENTGLVIGRLLFRAPRSSGFSTTCPDGRERAGTGRNPVRHGGQLADLEADRRQGACHRLHQRLPHHALQHPHPRLGRQDCWKRWTSRAVCCRR